MVNSNAPPTVLSVWGEANVTTSATPPLRLVHSPPTRSDDSITETAPNTLSKIPLFLDIHSKKPWPSNQLSNFANAPFTIDGLHFPCMECFLQSLKSPFDQEEYQFLTAREAKKRGSQIDWQRAGHLYWRGTAFRRTDWPTYRALLIRAYDAMFEANPQSAEALHQTGKRILWHTAGRLSKRKTCLTSFEFLYLLYRARRLQRHK